MGRVLGTASSSRLPFSHQGFAQDLYGCTLKRFRRLSPARERISSLATWLFVLRCAEPSCRAGLNYWTSPSLPSALRGAGEMWSASVICFSAGGRTTGRSTGSSELPSSSTTTAEPSDARFLLQISSTSPGSPSPPLPSHRDSRTDEDDGVLALDRRCSCTLSSLDHLLPVFSFLSRALGHLLACAGTARPILALRRRGRLSRLRAGASAAPGSRSGYH